MKNSLFQVAKPASLIKYILLSILTGAFSFGFITFVNRLINEMMHPVAAIDHRRNILIFAAIILFFVLSRRFLAISTIRFSQRIFWKLRTDIIHLVLKANYEQFKGKQNLVSAALIRDVNALTNASLNIIQFSTSVIMIIACFIYMALLSVPLFFITLFVVIAGISVYYWNMNKNQRFFRIGRDLDDNFIGSFNSLLSGFKEIQLDPRKGDEIYEKEIKVVSANSIRNSQKAYVGFLNNQMTGQVLFYCLIAFLLLFLKFWINLDTQIVVNFLFILLFLLGAVETTMVILPGLIQAKVSAERLTELRQELSNNEFSDYRWVGDLATNGFETIRVDKVKYRYPEEEGSGEEGFSIGPISLEINKGDVVFIYGGNGSGKTTFILTLLGLLKPSEGTIYLKDMPLDDSNYKAFRLLFGVVFSDFYLFNKLYGIGQVNKARADQLIELFELDGLVTFEGNAFSTGDMSTGQRKRLALIGTLLENKPILVLDEWAADQDPHFRRKFYNEIIPILKNDGYTLICITHDDKYYHCADRLYKMDYGRVKEVSVENI